MIWVFDFDVMGFMMKLGLGGWRFRSRVVGLKVMGCGSSSVWLDTQVSDLPRSSKVGFGGR